MTPTNDPRWVKPDGRGGFVFVTDPAEREAMAVEVERLKRASESGPPAKK